MLPIMSRLKPSEIRWLGIRLEAMGQAMNLAAALLIVFSRDWEGVTIKAGIAGLVLTYTQQVTTARCSPVLPYV